MAEDSVVCCVCLESLVIPGRSCQQLECAHMLHEDCVKAIRRFNSSGRCPFCRASSEDLAPVERLFADAEVLLARESFEEAFQKVSIAAEIPADLGSPPLLIP